MKTLLQINSSLHSSQGESSRLAARYAANWRAQHPQGRVIVRDFATDNVPHLTAEAFTAFGLPAARRDGAQALAVAYSDQLIGELQRADEIAIALPMYNFGVPSMLKAWFDHVARAGVTFRYTESGPVGLLTGKRAVVFATRGGKYAGTPSDTQAPWVRQILSFIGIDEVEFVYAEGLAYGPAAREASLAQAAQHVDALLAPQRAAA
ncbi:MAG TPA: NAD(P)H-dependent oxidoreductase [Xanthomonadales bacterium]|nr:NAD(P)H-dependent oxidoreductase [Xanthomonadales bacterium]